MDNSLNDKPWWNFLEDDLQELLKESLLLENLFQEKINLNNNEEFHDYSFVVFPAAKAYEGFLKKLFLELGFIKEADYFGKHFRIGKSLNPFLPEELEKESVYKKLVDFSGNEKLAAFLWETWKLSRNSTFHWFPNEKNAINFGEAERRIKMIISAIDEAFGEYTSKRPSN